MDEVLSTWDFEHFEGIGTLDITTKKDDTLTIEFQGGGDLEAVSGTFWVTGGTGPYDGFQGEGTYFGVPDTCHPMPPDCDGFYVDFTFTDLD